MPRHPDTLPAADSAVVGLILFAMGPLAVGGRQGYVIACAGAVLAWIGILRTYRRER